MVCLSVGIKTYIKFLILLYTYTYTYTYIYIYIYTMNISTEDSMKITNMSEKQNPNKIFYSYFNGTTIYKAFK